MTKDMAYKAIGGANAISKDSVKLPVGEDTTEELVNWYCACVQQRITLTSQYLAL